MKFKIILIILALTFPSLCQGAVLFEDNFNYPSGWTPSVSDAGTRFYPNGSLSNYEPSSQSAGQRNNTNSWNGYVRYGNNTINISTNEGRNSSGALKIGYENASPMNQVGLLKWLGAQGYRELYIRWYFKFDDRWCWGNGTNGSMVYFKTIRLWQGVDLNNLGGKNPMSTTDFPYYSIFNWQDDNYSTFSPFILAKFVNHTQDSVPTCPGTGYGPPCNELTWWNNPMGQMSHWLGALDSGGCFTQQQQWHSIEHHIRLRDTIANENAIYEVWIDGQKLTSPSDPYNKNPYASMDGGGINWIVLADNGTGGQYWPDKRYLYIDDFVISTTPVGTGTANLQGDLNNDHAVNIFDYNIFLANFGNAQCGNVADMDGNCNVNIFDYNVLLAHFGQSQ